MVIRNVCKLLMGHLTMTGTSGIMCRVALIFRKIVMPCFLKSSTRRIVLMTSLPKSSKTNTFQIGAPSDRSVDEPFEIVDSW